MPLLLRIWVLSTNRPERINQLFLIDNDFSNSDEEVRLETFHKLWVNIVSYYDEMIFKEKLVWVKHLLVDYENQIMK